MLENSPVGKVLALQHECTDLIPGTANSSIGVRDSNLSGVEVDTGRSLGFTGQPASPGR